jgi:hypothetical protein
MNIRDSTPQSDIPVLSVAELEADPHGILRHYRLRLPFIRRSDGAYLILRADGTCRRHYPGAAPERIASLISSRRISLPR